MDSLSLFALSWSSRSPIQLPTPIRSIMQLSSSSRLFASASSLAKVMQSSSVGDHRVAAACQSVSPSISRQTVQRPTQDLFQPLTACFASLVQHFCSSSMLRPAARSPKGGRKRGGHGRKVEGEKTVTSGPSPASPLADCRRSLLVVLSGTACHLQCR